MLTEAGNKRSNYEWEGDNMQKKSRKEGDGEEKVRLLVLGRYAGSLIGKGGENFTRLREKYKVKITGLSSRANERVVQLDGPREACLGIVRELLPLCPLARYKCYSVQATFELNLLANTDAVGMIIGKGGSKLREIALQTDTKIKVYPDLLPNSNERVVALGGETEDAVVKGIETVLGLLEAAPKRGQTVFFNPNNLEAGQEMPDLQAGKGNSGGDRQPGFHNQAPLDENNIGALLVAQRDLKQQKGCDPAIDFGSIVTTTVLTCSNELCGAIIGKGGLSIRHVKQVSGAQIEFNKSDGDSQRIITLNGTQDQIQIAQQLMAQCVRTSKLATTSQQQPQQQMQQPPPHFQQQMGYQHQNYPPMQQHQHSNYGNQAPWQPWD